MALESHADSVTIPRATRTVLPLETILGTPQALADTILDSWYLTSDADRHDGAEWYARAHGTAGRIAQGDLRQGAGVIAALSPQVSWPENVRLAELAFANGYASGHYGANLRKANSCLTGVDPLRVLGGNKVRAFYALILDPNDAYTVCVDRHAVSAAVGRTLDDSERKVLERKGAYDLVADAYRKAAAELGILPHQCQAITWVWWRKAKKVVDGQLSLC